MRKIRQLTTHQRHNKHVLLYLFKQEQTRAKQAELKFKLLWCAVRRGMSTFHFFDRRNRPQEGFQSFISDSSFAPCSDSASNWSNTGHHMRTAHQRQMACLHNECVGVLEMFLKQN